MGDEVEKLKEQLAAMTEQLAAKNTVLKLAAKNTVRASMGL